MRFFLPLWTHFGTSGDVGILDWYTISTGLLAFFTLTQHGALWIARKTADPLAIRAGRIARSAWAGVAVMTAVVTYFTMQVQPQVPHNLRDHPWGWIFPALALAGLVSVICFQRSRREPAAFLSSAVYIAGMLSSAAFGLYPYLLPSNAEPLFGLTIHNASAGPYGLRVGLMWWLPGMALAIGYFVFVYCSFGQKARPDESVY